MAAASHTVTTPPVGVPAPTVFAPIKVGAGSAVSGSPATLEFDFLPHTTPASLFSVNSNWTQGTTPALASGPSQLIGMAKRNSVVLSVPVDGKLTFIGVDSTLTADTGHLLYPGNQIAILGYNGPVWTLSSNGAGSIFYFTT
jgi:hypothetical protein